MDVVKILHDQVRHGATRCDTVLPWKGIPPMWAIDHLWVEMDTMDTQLFYGKIGKLGIVSIIGFAWLGIMDSVQHFIAVTTCWKAQKDAEKQHFTTFE